MGGHTSELAVRIRRVAPGSCLPAMLPTAASQERRGTRAERRAQPRLPQAPPAASGAQLHALHGGPR